MVFFQSKKDREGIFPIVDIGDYDLKFALCRKRKDELEVLVSGIESIESLTLEQSLRKVFRSMNEIREIIFRFPSAGFKARLGSFAYRRKNPRSFIIANEARLIRKEILEKGEKEMKRYFALNVGILAEDFQTQVLDIVEMKIDGYPVISLEGNRGEMIEGTIFGTFLLSPYIHILDSIAKKYRTKIKVVHISQAIQEFSKKKKQDGIFLDVGDKITHVVMMKNGSIAFLDEIKKGGDDFTRILEDTLGMRENTAREFQEKYAMGELSEELREKVRSLLLPEAATWLTLLQKSFEKAKIILPSDIFLLGGNGRLPEILEVVSQEEFSELPFTEPPRITLLSPRDLWNFLHFEHAGNPRYTSLFLLAYGRSSL